MSPPQLRPALARFVFASLSIPSILATWASAQTHAAEPLASANQYHLKGTILDQADHPLSDVRVGMRGAGASTQTDAKGAFTLAIDPTKPLTQDNTKSYDAVELDKDGYMGRTIEIKDLAMFDKPMTEKLGPPPVSADKAEFTMRMSTDITLPQISTDKEFHLIPQEQWQAYFTTGMADRKKTDKTEQVVFQAYIPQSAKKLKAMFLLTRHGIGSIDHPRLRAFADRNSVALVSVKGNPVQRGFYPLTLIDEPIARLGKMLKHPELAGLPVISFGHSNGTGFAGIVASQRADRTIGWISYHSGAAFHLQFPNVEQVPGLVFHGLIDPFFKNGQKQTIQQLRRERNAAVAFMLEANVAHAPVDKNQDRTWDFIAAFSEAAMRVRLNEDGTLKPVKIEQGWLGANYEVAKGGQQELPVAPYEDFKAGDKSAANWLPDEGFAKVWQTYGVTDPRGR